MSTEPDPSTTLPVFVWDGDDIIAFRAIEMLESYLEPEDVEAGPYSNAYGPNGQVYELTIISREVRVAFGRKATRRRVSVKIAESEPRQMEMLLSKLRSFAERTSLRGMTTAQIQALTPAELVELVAQETEVR